MQLPNSIENVSNNHGSRDVDQSQQDLLYKVCHNKPWIGGPGTMLPRCVESFLSWSLALSMLSVSGYHYIRNVYLFPHIRQLVSRCKKILGLTITNGKNDDSSSLLFLELTTSSREEQASKEDRYQQLLNYLQKVTGKKNQWNDDEIVQLIRSSDVIRRLVSLAIRQKSQNPIGTLLGQIQRLWPRLLPLPPRENKKSKEAASYLFDISVIIPAYRERGNQVRNKLRRARQTCRNPARIEIIVVDAGDCIELDSSLQDMSSLWGRFSIVSSGGTGSGGRGPCLNFGASKATGRILSFVHSDTTLPPQWDRSILIALDGNGKKSSNGIRATACAFSFGIDTSMEGLNGGPLPPGIKAVETTANWRTHMYSLPYGDQALSIPAVIFQYLGGFPDQCLMEDYELVSLLRRRAALLPQWGVKEKERVVIIGGKPALCSPRRWQKFGVLYVTFMNSRLVNLYASGHTPDSIFLHYYGVPPPHRSSSLAPWEEALSS